MNLNELKPGQSARIDIVGGEGALRQHFLDMGVIPGTEVTLVQFAPMGDPLELRIHEYELTLRLADAEKIDLYPDSHPAKEVESAAQTEVQPAKKLTWKERRAFRREARKARRAARKAEREARKAQQKSVTP